MKNDNNKVDFKIRKVKPLPDDFVMPKAPLRASVWIYISVILFVLGFFSGKTFYIMMGILSIIINMLYYMFDNEYKSVIYMKLAVKGYNTRNFDICIQNAELALKCDKNIESARRLIQIAKSQEAEYK